MACLAAEERSETEWYALLGRAGFRIKKICRYTEETQDAAIVAVPKEW